MGEVEALGQMKVREDGIGEGDGTVGQLYPYGSMIFAHVRRRCRRSRPGALMALPGLFGRLGSGSRTKEHACTYHLVSPFLLCC